MIKRISFVVFILLNFHCFAQKTIEITGRVFAGNEPLNGAAVYINNSMLGTTTNENGEFLLPVNQQKVELIVSFLGYETLKYDLDTSTYKNPIKFILVEKEEFLNEIIIKNIKYDEQWQYHVNVFKNSFIGYSEFAKNCEIENPKVLYFDYNDKTQELIAFAKEPLKIKNDALGYIIYFDLISFKKNNNALTYAGYTKYEEQKGKKRKKIRWQENRNIAYNGSLTHFLKSCIDNTLTINGFDVNQFKRILNPERPTDEEIEKARAYVKSKKTFIDFSKKISNPETKLDSAIYVLQKLTLPKFNDIMYKVNLQEQDIIQKTQNGYQLIFDDNLQVRYANEKVEKYYRSPFKKTDYSKQESHLLPIEKLIAIDEKGNVITPLGLFLEGYWAYEKFAYTLPLDYIPQKTN